MQRRTPRFTVVGALVAVLVAWVTAVFTAAQGAVPQPAAPSASAADVQAHLGTIKQYCASCHNDRTKTAGVSFEGATAETIAQHPDIFEKAVRKLRGRVMPPPNARQPAAAAVDSLVAWLESSLDRAAGRAHLT